VASFDHVGGNALANITATALVHVNAAENIAVESINVVADAENWGDNAAVAHASLNMNAGGSINLADQTLVAATADNHNSQANASGTAAAVASALAHFNGTAVRGTEARRASSSSPMPSTPAIRAPRPPTSLQPRRGGVGRHRRHHARTSCPASLR
jgi:hypothetical protein